MYRPVFLLVALAAAPAASFAASAPVRPSKATAPSRPTNLETALPSSAETAQSPNPELAALAAAAAAQGWVNLLRDPALADWQRIPLPADTPLNPRNPWRYDLATGILHCDGTGLHEMLLHRTERGDGVFHVEWRYAGAPAKSSSGILVRTKPDNSAWHQAELAPNGLGMLIGVSPGTDGKARRFNSGRRRPDLLRKAGEWNVTEIQFPINKDPPSIGHVRTCL